MDTDSCWKTVLLAQHTAIRVFPQPIRVYWRPFAVKIRFHPCNPRENFASIGVFQFSAFSFQLFVHVLYFCPGPGSFAEEREAGLDARIEEKTTDGDLPSHFLPAKMRDEFREYPFQRYAVQRIVGFELGHDFLFNHKGTKDTENL
jgi:hypothetical protein